MGMSCCSADSVSALKGPQVIEKKRNSQIQNDSDNEN